MYLLITRACNQSSKQAVPRAVPKGPTVKRGVSRAVKKAAAAAAVVRLARPRLLSKIKLNQAAGQTSPAESFYIYNAKEATALPAAQQRTLSEKVN